MPCSWPNQKTKSFFPKAFVFITNPTANSKIASINRLTMSMLPPTQAQYNGVFLYLSVMLISTPLSIRCIAAEQCPRLEADMRGVLPEL